MAGRPATHTTPEAKLQAARQKRKKYHHRHKDTINTKRRLSYTPTKHKKYSIPPKSEMSGMDTPPTSSARESLSPAPTTLSGCLELVKDAKDELVGLAVLPGPYAYVEHILGRYVATVPRECFDIETVDREEPGDISIIDDAICTVRKIYENAYRGQDAIFDMCGVCDEWRAADEVCRAIHRVIGYLEDVLWHVRRGTTELAITHVHQKLKYQSDRLDNM
ncbi:hypothetical protein EV424DRAFT_1352142 [Suillus variegatus]|nr:hypothetical protein EV424DRAFT_1352142 [Suillus variegatus]